MGSFQQVVMGGICLVAAFWFGSYINEQPAALQQPLERFSNAVAGPGIGNVQVPSQLVAKPQGGLLSSFFESSAKPRPVTLSDLKSRSTSKLNNVVAQNATTPFVAAQKLRLPERMTEAATEVVSDFVKPPLPGFGEDPSFVADNIQDRFIPNNHSDHVVSNKQNLQQPLEIISNNHSNQQRLEIVPDFTTLAQDFKRDQAAQYQQNVRVSETPATSGQLGSMLPVPKLEDFSRASFGRPLEQPNRDWNAVRQGVVSVEDKLKQFHKAHPVAEEFEPLRPESRFPVTAKTTSGRFIPEPLHRGQEFKQGRDFNQSWDVEQSRNFQQEESDRREIERLQVSLREYERQELERQEIQRQEFRKRRPQAFVPNSSWNNADRSTMPSISSNPLAAQEQFTDREQAREQRYQSSRPAPVEFDRPAPPESLAQRQERWKVFGDRTSGDRTGESKSAFDENPAARDLADYGSNQSRSAAEVRAPVASSIPESSRVRSLYNMPLEEGDRSPEHAAGRQDVFANQNASRPSPTQRQRTPRARAPRARTSSESSTSDAGPEVIRYGDFKTYTTEGGDTLQTISESFFGTPEYYFDLYLANRNVLVNPATVPVGIELRIPRMGQ